MQLYDAYIYVTGYDVITVEAESEDEALQKARKIHDEKGFQNPSSLMRWQDADTVELA